MRARSIARKKERDARRTKGCERSALNLKREIEQVLMPAAAANMFRMWELGNMSRKTIYQLLRMHRTGWRLYHPLFDQLHCLANATFETRGNT